MNQKQCGDVLMAEEPQITLEKFIDVRVKGLKEYTDTRFEAIEKHREAAFEANNVRLESMNKFRNDLERQAATFVTRLEMEAKQDAFNTRVSILEGTQNVLAGKASQNSVNIALAFSVMAVVATLCGSMMGVITLLTTIYRLFFQP
jgi:hypothetical protein